MEIVLTVLAVLISAVIVIGFAWIISGILDTIFSIPKIYDELVKIRKLLDK